MSGGRAGYLHLGATEDGYVPLLWCCIRTQCQPLVPAYTLLTQSVRCAVMASIGQGKEMAWAGSGPPLTNEGRGSLVPLV